MKVALLGPCPATPGADQPLPGGVDAVVVTLARGLAASPGIRCDLVTSLPGLAAVERVPADDIPWHRVPRPRGGRLTGQRQIIRSLAAQIAEIAPDIVHAHSAGVYAAAAQASDLPTVITLHGMIAREARQAWPASRWPDRLRWLADAALERAVVRQATDIIAISPYVQAEFRGRTPARFHLIENPIDERYFTDPTPPPGDGRLLSVARVIPRKGTLALVEAFATMARRHPAITLTIVGETSSAPEYVARCVGRAAALGVSDRIRLVGAQPPDVIRGHLAASDVVLLSSEQETAPVTIAEAMAAARPVVTTDVGGCAALVADGVTGRVVPPRDPQALAAATVELLADPERAAAMGRAGRAAAEARFRLAPIIAATLEVYARILAERANAQRVNAQRATAERLR